MTTDRELAAMVNALNARQVRIADAVASVAVAVILGALAALALAYYLTPCDAGHLCAGGALLRTGPQRWWQYLMRPARRAYLRVLIRSAEQDATWHAETIELAPIMRNMARSRAAELRAELALLEP